MIVVCDIIMRNIKIKILSEAKNLSVLRCMDVFLLCSCSSSSFGVEDMLRLSIKYMVSWYILDLLVQWGYKILNNWKKPTNNRKMAIFTYYRFTRKMILFLRCSSERNNCRNINFYKVYVIKIQIFRS